MGEKKAWIGAGSNLGDRKESLQKAVNLFSSYGIEFIRSSSIYASDPVGFESENQFLNCVFEVEFNFTPRELLQKLLLIESELGRERYAGIRHSNRTIDLDILLIENEVINTTDLVVPHPEMHHRAFVLNPLSELIPLSFHPILNESVNNLKKHCIDGDSVFIHDKPLFVNR